MYSSGTAAAFTADSFVIDTDPYLFESIQASSFSLRDSASAYSVSAASSTNSDPMWFFDNCTVSIDASVAGMWYSDSSLKTPFYDSFTLHPSLTVDSDSSGSWSTYVWFSKNELYWEPNTNLHYDSATLIFPAVYLSVSGLDVDSICFSGGIYGQLSVWGYNFSSYKFGKCSVYVNGSKVRDFTPDSSGYFQFNDFIYSSSTGINSVDLVFFDGPSKSLSITNHTPQSINGPTVQFWFKPWTLSNFSFTTLSDDQVLNGLNDNAQDAMNQQDAIESQWTGSMTENFNNLSLSDFSFPVAAVNGFSLISGIFNDLWNAMGDFRIVYVFPLTLGVVLLLIGRLSRTSVKRSSGRGDDDA